MSHYKEKMAILEHNFKTNMHKHISFDRESKTMQMNEKYVIASTKQIRAAYNKLCYYER